MRTGRNFFIKRGQDDVKEGDALIKNWTSIQETIEEGLTLNFNKGPSGRHALAGMPKVTKRLPFELEIRRKERGGGTNVKMSLQMMHGEEGDSHQLNPGKEKPKQGREAQTGLEKRLQGL